MRGIAVCWVIFSHVETQCYPISIWYHSYFVALFFFLSGYLYKERSTFLCLKRNIKTLGFFGITSAIAFAYGLIKGNYFIGESVKLFIKVFIMDKPLEGSESIWFLPVLLIIELIYGLLRKLNNKTLITIAVIGTTTVGWILNVCGSDYPLRIDTVMIALSIYHLGAVFKELRLIDYFESKMLICLLISLSISVGGAIFHYQKHESYLSFAGGEFGNPVLFYIEVISGCVFTLILSLWLCLFRETTTKWIQFIGRESLYCVCVHGFIIIAVRKIVRLLLHINMSFVNDCVVYISVMIISLALIYCYRKVLHSEGVHDLFYKEDQRKI